MSNNVQEKPFNIDEYVYAKQFTCPVCQASFASILARDSKLRFMSVEYDLRPVFTPIEPMFYDLVLCETCGWCAPKESFAAPLKERQQDAVGDKITANFKKVPYPKEPSVDEAIGRYKHALLCAEAKNGPIGERAYLYMKLTWLYRVKGGELENEKAAAKAALESFTKSISEDDFPVAGLEEHTVFYLISAFSTFLGDYKNALASLSRIITNDKASKRLKDRARDLKDMIKEKQEAGE